PRLLLYSLRRNSLSACVTGRSVIKDASVASLMTVDSNRTRFRTASGPGSPSGQPAWGGGCDRPLGTQSSRLLVWRHAKARAVGTTAYPGQSLPLAVLKRPNLTVGLSPRHPRRDSKL